MKLVLCTHNIYVGLEIRNLSGLKVVKQFSCSTHLSMKFILPINVKMPTIVGILSFISRINTTSDGSKTRNIYISQIFSFYEELKFYAHFTLQ